MRRAKIFLAFVLSIISANIFIQGTASAADLNTVKTKAALEGVYQCFQNGAFRASFSTSDWTNNSGNLGRGKHGIILSTVSEEAVKLPYGLTDATDNNTNCQQILFGFGSDIDGDELNKGLVKSEVSVSTDKEVIKNYVSGNDGAGRANTLGYKATPSGDAAEGATTHQLHVKISDSYECRNPSGDLLAKSFTNLQTNETFSELIFPAVTNNANGNWFFGDASSSANGANVPLPGSGETMSLSACDLLINIQDVGNDKNVYYTVQFSSATVNADTMVIGGGESGYSVNGFSTYGAFSSEEVTGTVGSGDASSFDNYDFTYTGQNSIKGIVRHLKNTNSIGYRMGDLNSYDDLALSPQEVYDLYTYYVKSVFKYPVVCEGDSNYEAYTGAKDINWSKDKKCKIDSTNTSVDAPSGNVYGVDSSYHFTARVEIDDIIVTLGTLDLSVLDTSDAGTVTPSSNVDVEDDAEAQMDPCYNAGLESMAWILCPTLNNSVQTISIIDELTKDWLEVGTNLYDSESAAYKVWGMMRIIANFFMIIVLLIIIISQLTGYGIDNYGIKKMLPKLILMAVFINLSFLICQLAIDLSNILGSGLNQLFRGIAVNIFPEQPGPNFLSWVIGMIFAAVGVVGTFAGVAITAGTVISGGGPMAVVVIVLLVIAALAAILIFFAMLGARMIIIVLCSAVSPIAFACYILPNTRDLFKKWWNIFKTALVIFPICGALGGISYLIKCMVSNTDMSSETFWMFLVAVIAPFLPFYVLPTLLKATLAALGKVGGALTAIGSGIRGGIKGTQRAVENTDSYKSTVQAGRLNQLRRRVGMGENGQLTEKGIERLRKAQARGGRAARLYNARLATVEKGRAEDESAATNLLNAAARTEIPNAVMPTLEGTAGTGSAKVDFGTAFSDGTRESYYAGQFLNAAATGDTNGMNAAIAAMKAAGVKDKYIASMVRQAQNGGYMKFAGKDKAEQDNARRAWYQDLSTRYGNGFLATDYELAHYAMNGAGQDTLGDYGAYAKSFIKRDDFKKEDLLKLSGDSLAGMAASGLISQGMAQQIVAENPNLSEDKKIMFAALASGAATAASIQASATPATATTPGISGSAQFKMDVETLMNNHGATVASINTGGNADMVKSWTAPAPSAVNVVQDFRSGYSKQQNPVDVAQAGAYEDPAGNTYRVRRTIDGKFVDDGGFEVQIDHFRPK